MVDDECGAIGGMLGKGNRGTRRKSAPSDSFLLEAE
jgi:hypothetical protein